MVFGRSLREAVNSDPEQFDRVKILQQTHDPMVQAAGEVLQALR